LAGGHTDGAYRADIDGLRAVAILPVLLFHAGLPGWSGGYVGVDVFFVISGYLITGIIAREIDAGTFSIINFYERRARRIMPALMAMIAAVLVAVSMVFLPADFADVPGSAATATLFVSNVHFFLDVGYFAGAAETKPLLHTWSLAVEEQFYIGFPILLFLIAHYAPQRRTVIVAAIALVSFAWAVVTQAKGNGFAFYMLPPRAWELFAGALLALGALPAFQNRMLREAVALGGLAAIGYAVATFTKTTIFPGTAALFPVLGAAALIQAAPGTMTGRVLSLRPLVALGLISYSLYLWHWPLIVLTQYATDAPLAGASRIAVIAGSVALAILSTHFIERPFRKRARYTRKALFALTGAAMTAVCLTSTGMALSHGWPSRFAPEVLQLANARNDFSPMRGRCNDDPRTPCKLGTGAKPDALLWGDSHGIELAYALSRSPPRRGHAMIQQTLASCPPVLGFAIPGNADCAQHNDAVLAQIRADPLLRTIYLAGFWASDAFGSPDFARQLDATVTTLHNEGRRVVIFGAVPPQPFDVPRYLAHRAQAGQLASARGVSRAVMRQRIQWLTPLIARWRAAGIEVIDPVDMLCRKATCDIIRDGKPLYFDTHHLSNAGARLLVDQLAKE
jgi:peptidoglycan/LPS O-acetylase OafA/YrhL